jgi:SAM-dependent methyltransferase
VTEEEPIDARTGSRERDYVTRNRGAWNEWATEFVPPGESSWSSEDPYWGIWKVPEAELGVLPSDLDGKDTIELGCGTGYVSAWMARRGARPVGIDLSKEQLATARRLQEEHGLSFPLHEGNAEELPFPDASFDLAISEYGASIWADPYRWIPEASRVLRPGGELIFLVSGTLAMLCSPDNGEAPTDALQQDYFGMHRFEWPDWPSVEFHLSYGDMIRLLRANGFEIEDLIELRPAEDAELFAEFTDMISLAWSRRWPCEEVWKARKTST